MRLRCSNPECESRTCPKTEAYFHITVSVDDRRRFVESVDRDSIDAACFTCSYCDCDAEEANDHV